MTSLEGDGGRRMLNDMTLVIHVEEKGKKAGIVLCRVFYDETIYTPNMVKLGI